MMWPTIKLKYLNSEKLQYGANESANQSNVDHPRYIRITDFSINGDLKPETFKSLSPEIASDYILADGDLLLARSGATVGKAFYYRESMGICCFAGYLIRFRPRRGSVNNRFVWWYSQSALWADEVKLATIQATIQNVSADRFGNFLCPLPPLSTQKAIADFLDRKTAAIDALIAKKQRLLELLAQQRQALITHAVTKGLNPDAPMKDSGIPWLGQIPAHWEVKALKNACILQRGFDLPRQRRGIGQVPIVTGAGIVGHHDTAMVKAPGVVTGRYGTIGKFYYIEKDFWPLNTSLYIKFFWGNHPLYIRHLLAAIPLDGFSDKSAVPGINRNDLHKLKIPVPDFQTQVSISGFLSNKEDVFEKIESKTKTQITKLKEYRQALITAAVTGQIDVSTEAPFVQPAK